MSPTTFTNCAMAPVLVSTPRNSGCASVSSAASLTRSEVEYFVEFIGCKSTRAQLRAGIRVGPCFGPRNRPRSQSEACLGQFDLHPLPAHRDNRLQTGSDRASSFASG